MYKSLCLVFLLSASVFGQAQFGSISGIVTDPTGAVIPGVEVLVTNTETGTESHPVSNSAGRYTVPQIQPGTYRITAATAGFKAIKSSVIKLDTNQSLSFDLTLEVGSVSETLEVSAEATRIDTLTGSVGTVIDNKPLQEIPLNGRDVTGLINLVPGSFSLGGKISIGGGRVGSASAMLDGTTNSRGGLGQQNVEVSPPIEMMQEFKVESNNYSAQYGRSNAGIMNATTKSGTNKLKGVLYEYLRNDKLDSRGWFADSKAPLHRNQFGGAVGGPIRQNRTFYFYNYDTFRQSTGTPHTRTVPLPEWRTGDFSTLQRQVNSAQGPVGSPLILYDPLQGQQIPFPGNRIPLSRMDPVSLKAIELIPLPNRVPDNAITRAGNWQKQSKDPTIVDYHTARIDHAFSDKTMFYVRYLFTARENNSTAVATPGYGAADPDAQFSLPQHQNLVANVTHVITPALFVSGRLGYQRTRTDGHAVEPGQDWAGKLGLKGVAPDAFPSFQFTSGLVPVTSLGITNQQSRQTIFATPEGSLDLTFTHGTHTLKAGATQSRFITGDENHQSSSGVFTFGSQYTAGLTASGAAIANTGMAFADFLLGRPTSVTQRLIPDQQRRSEYSAGYVEDQWRIMARLSLNLGVRYEYESPLRETSNKLSNFNPYIPAPLAGTGDIPAGVLGAYSFAGRNGNGSTLWNPDRNNLSPRFGFAWKPLSSSQSTVVRGGIGLFYGNQYDRSTSGFGTAGFEQNSSVVFPVPFTLAQGVPGGTLATTPDSLLTPAFGTRGLSTAQSTVQTIDQNRRTQYSINYNFTVQREWKGIVFDASYIANLGRKIIFQQINLNQIPTNLLSHTEIPERLRRPFPQFTGDRPIVQAIAPNWGISNYHAFTFKTEKRFSNGVSWTGTYAFSKWIDNVPFAQALSTFGDNSGLQNIYDRSGDRALSGNHIPHRIVIAPVVELPFGKGRRFMSQGRVLNAVLGGWQVSGIVTMQAGSPFGVTVVNGTRDLLGDQANTRILRANLVGDVNLPDNRQGTPAVGQRGVQWFNTAAFAAPGRFTFGNSGRSVMLGPGIFNLDAGLFRNIQIKERYRLQFRWEAFNATNTPVWGIPGDQLGNGNFGISTATGDREIQFALKLYF